MEAGPVHFLVVDSSGGRLRHRLVEMVLLRRCVTHTFSVEALARRVKCSLMRH